MCLVVGCCRESPRHTHSCLLLLWCRYPVVPEFLDMTCSLTHALKEAPHYDPGEHTPSCMGLFIP